MAEPDAYASPEIPGGPVPSVPKPKARARYAARRDEILNAASRVFTESGVSGFTLAAVAKRMDLHPVSLTYYFKRKEDLAAACMLHALERFGDMLSEAEREATPQARLRRFVVEYFAARERIAERDDPQLAPLGEMRMIDGPHGEALRRAYDEISHRIALILKDREAPLSGGRRRALAHLIIHQLCWTDSWIGAYETADYGRLGERVADILIGGLAADGAVQPTTPLLTVGGASADNDEVTREAYLKVAIDLINKEGFRGASVDKISARLNVTKGSFYHHNSDKDELILACFERTFELIDAAKREATATGRTGWERLWLATASLAVMQASGEPGRLLRQYGLAALSVDDRRAIVARFQQIAHGFAGVISDGIADGSIRPVDPLLAAHLVMAMFNSALPLSYWSSGATLDTVVDAHVRPALMGFLTPGRAEL